MKPLQWSLLALVACTPSKPTPPPFPETFLWGASVAGFQVDMGCPTLEAAKCNDTRSDWYDFTARRAELSDLHDVMSTDLPVQGPGFWELYAQDLDRAKEQLGLGAFRLSIEWSRVFPNATDGLEGDALRAAASADALAGYHAIFQALKARGMKPMVTLNHYTLPVWIHDGVACHQNVSTCTNRGWLGEERLLREMAKYAGFVAKEFGAEVDLWATENEPFAVVLPGYLLPTTDRLNPPALRFQTDGAKQVMVAMIRAHARMYDAVKTNDVADLDGDGTAASIGLVYATVPVKPRTDSAIDKRGAERVFYLYNTVFLDGVARGDLDIDLDGVAEIKADPTLVNRLDWLGLNYYTRITTSGTGDPQLPALSKLTTFDITSLVLWEDYPQGLTDIAVQLGERYRVPMYVTETGARVEMNAEAGKSWVVRYAEATKQAIAQGADVRGFFYWSLMDNFEWNHGLGMRFGLWGVDFTSPMKPRTARSSVAAYQQIISANDVPAALKAEVGE